MWYEDRADRYASAHRGYAVAQSSSPAGPFTTTHAGVSLPGRGRIGDFALFVDGDGVAYHVRTGFDVVTLNADFTAAASNRPASSFATPKQSEGPVVFRRGGFYYVLAGAGQGPWRSIFWLREHQRVGSAHHPIRV